MPLLTINYRTHKSRSSQNCKPKGKNRNSSKDISKLKFKEVYCSTTYKSIKDIQADLSPM